MERMLSNAPDKSPDPHPIRRRQTQHFALSNMAPKAPKPQQQQQQQQQTGISVFLRKLEKPVSEIQRFMAEFPDYEEQFLEHEKTHTLQKELARELEERDRRTKQLEAAVAAFEGVHMNSSKALKEENGRLGQRLAGAEARIAETERSLEAAQKAHREQLERLAREKNQEMDKAARDQAASLERQKARFEKQHSETVERNNAQLAKVTSDMQKQGAEMEKLELINEGLKDRASKLKELQQEFSNIPDDVFKTQLKELSKRFHGFCKARFMSVPEGSTPEQLALRQQDIKERLLRVGFTEKMPFPIPTGNIEASKLLRLAGVEHIISESLCTNIFRPVAMHDCSDSSVFEAISERLHKQNPWKEAMWRTSTVSALDGHTNLDAKLRLMVADVMKLTSPLIAAESRDLVATELEALFKLAFEIWKPAQQNLSRIFATTVLSHASAGSWESHSEQDNFYGASEDELADIDAQQKVLCLFPRIYRERTFTIDKGIDPEDPGCVYFPGAALYADAEAHVVGLKEHRELERMMEELSRKAQVAAAEPGRVNNRRSRRQSTTAPMMPALHAQAFGARVKKVLGEEKEKEKEKEKERRVVSDPVAPSPSPSSSLAVAKIAK